MLLASKMLNISANDGYTIKNFEDFTPFLMMTQLKLLTLVAVAYVQLMISFQGIKECCEIQTPNDIAHQPKHQLTSNFWENEKALYIAMIVET